MPYDETRYDENKMQKQQQWRQQQQTVNHKTSCKKNKGKPNQICWTLLRFSFFFLFRFTVIIKWQANTLKTGRNVLSHNEQCWRWWRWLNKPWQMWKRKRKLERYVIVAFALNLGKIESAKWSHKIASTALNYLA